jgi:hypothetical protein
MTIQKPQTGSGAIQVGGKGSGGMTIQKPQTGSGAVQVGGSGSAQVGSGAISLPGDKSQQQSGGVFTRGKQSVQAFFAQYGVRLP